MWQNFQYPNLNSAISFRIRMLIVLLLQVHNLCHIQEVKCQQQSKVQGQLQITQSDFTGRQEQLQNSFSTTPASSSQETFVTATDQQTIYRLTIRHQQPPSSFSIALAAAPVSPATTSSIVLTTANSRSTSSETEGSTGITDMWVAPLNVPQMSGRLQIRLLSSSSLMDQQSLYTATSIFSTSPTTPSTQPAAAAIHILLTSVTLTSTSGRAASGESQIQSTLIQCLSGSTLFISGASVKFSLYTDLNAGRQQLYIIVWSSRGNSQFTVYTISNRNDFGSSSTSAPAAITSTIIPVQVQFDSFMIQPTAVNGTCAVIMYKTSGDIPVSFALIDLIRGQLLSQLTSTAVYNPFDFIYDPFASVPSSQCGSYYSLGSFAANFTMTRISVPCDPVIGVGVETIIYGSGVIESGVTTDPMSITAMKVLYNSQWTIRQFIFPIVTMDYPANSATLYIKGLHVSPGSSVNGWTVNVATISNVKSVQLQTLKVTSDSILIALNYQQQWTERSSVNYFKVIYAPVSNIALNLESSDQSTSLASSSANASSADEGTTNLIVLIIISVIALLSVFISLFIFYRFFIVGRRRRTHRRHVADRNSQSTGGISNHLTNGNPLSMRKQQNAARTSRQNLRDSHKSTDKLHQGQQQHPDDPGDVEMEIISSRKTGQFTEGMTFDNVAASGNNNNINKISSPSDPPPASARQSTMTPVNGRSTETGDSVAVAAGSGSSQTSGVGPLVPVPSTSLPNERLMAQPRPSGDLTSKSGDSFRLQNLTGTLPTVTKSSGSMGMTSSSMYPTQYTMSITTNINNQTSASDTIANTTTVLHLPGYLQIDIQSNIEMLETIGQGGFGVIKKGLIKSQKMIDDFGYSLVAVKFFQYTPGEGEQVTDEDFAVLKTAFEQEIAVTKQFQYHPNVVKMSGFSLYHPSALVLKFYDLGNLYDLTFGKRKIPNVIYNFTLVVSLLCDVSNALTELHKYGISHCDIKPANVLLDTDPVTGDLSAVLCDFGMTNVVSDKLLGVKAFKRSELDGGSLAFSAPEVITQHPDRDHFAADVYSFGLLMFCSAARKGPWWSLNPERATEQIVEGERPKFPDNVLALLNKSVNGRKFQDLVRICWSEDILFRPKMSFVRGQLEDLKRDGFDIKAPGNQP